jgi:site-specific DNA recombinase
MTTRAGLYSRVSSDMQLSGHSLDAQRRGLHDACTLRGYTIALEETDEALSARSDRIELRPGLSRLLDAVRERRIDVLMVHSLDRLARNVMTTLTVFKLLAEHQCAFVSLTESIDYTTPEGKLQLTILGAFCAYFSDNLAKHVSKGKAERVAQGKHNNSLPTGYSKDASGAVVFDPATVDTVRGIWQMATEGLTMRQIGRAVGMASTTVKTILENRFYCGAVRYHKTWQPGQHPALIDAATFDAAWTQRIANRRLGSRPPQARHVYTFGGLLTCARCGSHLTGDHQGAYYICSGRRFHSCDQPMVRDDVLCAQFAGLLSRLAVPQDAIADAVAQLPAPRVVDVAGLARRLDRLRDLFELGDLARSEYVRRRDEIRASIAQAEQVTASVQLDSLAARVRELAGLWADGDKGARQRITATLVQDILVDGKAIVALRPHGQFVPLLALFWPPAERQAYYSVR